MKGKLSFIMLVVIILGVLLIYTFTATEYPRIPADDFHKGAAAVAACMECHGPGKKYEMKKTHPPKFECLKCHKAADAKK